MLLLCCAGALIAEGLPAQEQEQVIEMLQQELSTAKTSEVGFPSNTEEQENGFPSVNEVSEEQEKETAEEERYYKAGVVYTRWGSTECPKTATRVYFGRAAGAYYSHPGTAANYICMPHTPEYYSSTKKATYAALVYGSEYETWGSPLPVSYTHLTLPTILLV